MQFEPPLVENEQFLNFGAAIHDNARRMGDKPALIVEGRQIGWRDFGAMVAQVSARLQAEGVGRGQMVATLAGNTAEHVVLYCATVAAGACIVPLPFSATPAALTRMMQNSGAALLFADGPHLAVAHGLGAARVVELDSLTAWAAGAGMAAPADVRPDDLFNMIYSSGTTGLPKGIVHDHRFRSRQLLRIARFGLTEASRLVISTPLYSNTTLFGMLPVLSLGATLIMMPKFSTTGFLDLSEALTPSHAVLVPVQFMRLMDAPDFDARDLSSYQCKFSTSAHLPAALIERIMARWPGNLIEIYGMTEGGMSTALNCDAFRDKWDTVGRPGEGVDMRVIDPEGRELPQGEYGELVGRSGSMMRAYHNQPDKTAELLWTDAQGRHFVRSGDMGRIDADGFVHLMDRKKDMIISGGFNIYAADLETVLRGHADVVDVAVIAVPSADWGETPLGFVVLRQGAVQDADAVRDWANARLGKTQRLSHIEIRADLPRSDIGKILKRDLRAPYWPD